MKPPESPHANSCKNVESPKQLCQHWGNFVPVLPVLGIPTSTQQWGCLYRDRRFNGTRVRDYKVRYK
eukprot:2019153-Rhodomonas_salina.1